MNPKSKSNSNKKTTKTSTVKNSEKLKLSTGPQIIDGFLHFSPLDLTRFELVQAKVVNALQAIGLKKAEAEEARRTYEDKVRKFNEELATILFASKRAEDEARSLQKELEESYHLDFSKVTYDDVSGKISVLGDPVSEDEFLTKQDEKS